MWYWYVCINSVGVEGECFLWCVMSVLFDVLFCWVGLVFLGVVGW